MPATQRLVSFEIQDELSAAALGAIEVHLQMSDGSYRWCFFMTPAALTACGNWLTGTNVRIHLGVRHMIVTSEIDENVIRASLEELDQQGQLIEHTLDIATP